MKIRCSSFLICFILLLTSCKEEKGTYADKLWYDQPAENWMQALPIGNGRLGAMVFGDPNHERIQLNEDSMWPGGPDWGDGRGTPEDLEEIRKLLKEGKTKEVDSLMVERFSYKTIVRSHQTMGDLYIDFLEDKSIENYSRELNLDDGVVNVRYSSGGHEYSQTVFASNPDDVLVVELSTTNPEGMDFNLKLDRPKDEGQPTVTTQNPSENEISMMGMVTQLNGKRDSKPLPIDYGVRFETRLSVVNESGTISTDNGQLSLKSVKKAKILISGNTSFYYPEEYEQKNAETLAKASNESFESLLATHKKDHKGLYDRVALDLGGKELDSLPINQRLQRMKDGLV